MYYKTSCLIEIVSNILNEQYTLLEVKKKFSCILQNLTYKNASTKNFTYGLIIKFLQYSHRF